MWTPDEPSGWSSMLRLANLTGSLVTPAVVSATATWLGLVTIDRAVSATAVDSLTAWGSGASMTKRTDAV